MKEFKKQLCAEVLDFLRAQGFEILKRQVKTNGIHVLAKEPKTGKNITFLADGTELKRFCCTHTKMKGQPYFYWETVKQTSTKHPSRRAALEAAIQKETPRTD